MTENMRSHFSKRIAMIMALALLVVAAGCKKHVPPPPPLPPGGPGGVTNPNEGGRPVVSSFTAEPRTIARGQSSTLRWSISGATDMNIDQGIGPIQSSGSRQVFPSTTTTYTLVANGPGGTDTRSVTVEVSTPPPPPGTPGPGSEGDKVGPGDVERLGQDAYFDYDKADIRPDAADALRRDADLLKRVFQQNPNLRIIIEGHCDERGSDEYNLALGDRRADAAMQFLVQLGVPAGNLSKISYGKQKPQCTDANEGCYQKNRRAHLAVSQ